MNDPYNNVGRHCSILGEAGYRVWRLEEFVRDRGGNATYVLRHVETGARVRANIACLTNLY